MTLSQPIKLILSAALQLLTSNKTRLYLLPALSPYISEPDLMNPYACIHIHICRLGSLLKRFAYVSSSGLKAQLHGKYGFSNVFKRCQLIFLPPTSPSPSPLLFPTPHSPLTLPSPFTLHPPPTLFLTLTITLT